MHTMTNQAHAYSNLKQVAQEANLAKQSQGSHTPFWEWGRGPWNWENLCRFD